MEGQLKRHEPLEFGLERIARERLSTALRQVTAATSLDVETVHETRKSVKALRALLRLTRGAIDDTDRRERNRILRDFAATFSAERDAEVLSAAFQALCKEALPAPEFLEGAPPWLEDARRALGVGTERSVLVEQVKVRAESIAPLARRFLPLQPSVVGDRNGSSEEEAWRRDVAIGLRKTHRAARKLLGSALSVHVGPEEDWHELRKRVKDLGYQLEVFEKVKAIRRLKTRLGEMGSALGDARDLSLLRDRLLTVRAGETLTTSEQTMREFLLTHIDARREKLRRQALRAARQVYRVPSKKFVKRIAKRWHRWREG